MNAAHTASNAIAPTAAVDFDEVLLALPSCGALLGRMRTLFSNWAEAAVESQAEPRWWGEARADSRATQEQAPTRFFR
jgi:hypothetical protein